jgi:hypothetical protein
VTTWTGEELRRVALDRLGVHADERTRETLAHASLAIVPAVARWDSSAGPVEAHRVTLGVDAGTLGMLRAAPSLVDALCAALAAAVATRPRETLHDLALRWTAGARASASGYRDAPPPAPAIPLSEAIAAYLRASGDGALADALFPMDVDASDPAEIAVRVARPARDALRGDARAVEKLMRTIRDLLGDDAVRVRLR